MKNILKKILTLSFLILLFIVSSCEKDLYENTLSEGKNFKHGIMSFSQIKALNPKAASTIIEVNTDIQAKSKTTLFGIEIDTTIVTYVEKEDGFKSYSLKVKQQEGLTSFKNLVLSEFPNGKFQVRLVKFNLSKTYEEVKAENSLNESVVNEEVMKYDFGNQTLTLYECIEIGYYETAPACEGVNLGYWECYDENGNELTVQVYVLVDQWCTEIGGTDGGDPGWTGWDGSGAGVNPNTGGGSGDSEEPFIPNLLSDTEPLSPTTVLPLGWLLKNFEENLDEEFELPTYNTHPEFREYLANNDCRYSAKQFVIWAISYLNMNDSSSESVSFINNLLYPANVVTGLENPTNITNENIDYLVQNYFSTESINHVQNVLQEVIEESNNPSTIDNPDLVLVEAPQSNLITDINDYLDCFDTNQNAVFTLFVDQPTPNSNEPWSGNPTDPDVGHTYISIKQGNIRRVIGLYPSSGVSPTSPAVAGAFYNDSGHHFDVSLSVVMNPSQLNNVLNYIKGQSGGTYNLNSNNCTDFGLATIRLAGVKMPSAHGSWGLGSGDNPGQLGQNIRNMPTPTGGVKNTTGGTGVSNTGGC